MQWEFTGSRVTPFGALRLLTGYPWPLRYFKAKALYYFLVYSFIDSSVIKEYPLFNQFNLVESM